MILINNKIKLGWNDKLTVAIVLEQLGYNFSLITVTVNGNYIPPEDYETAFIPDNAEVGMFHLAHGG